MTEWSRTVAAAIFLLLLGAGCSSGVPASGAPKTAGGGYTVVCTVGMITDIARQVVGDRGTVVGLMGEGVDPHLFSPTRSDIATLMRGDVVFYNGLLLEGKMTDALIRVATAGKKVYAVTELLDEEYLLEPAEFKGLYDPHVWMDPRAWRQAVAVIRDKIIDFDPAGRALHEANAALSIEKLVELDAYAERVLGNVPASQRVLVTAHDAFNYFGRRYGFEVVGIQGISTESEAGVQDIERLVDLIVDRKVKAVFVESTVARRNIQALITGARAQGHQVVIGGELYSDAMGAPGTYRGTYLGMIDHNVTTIARALGGNPPAGGFSGRLEKE